MDSKAEIFLSCCWADETIADDIYDYLVRNVEINLHRDRIDIGTWESIKTYMESIPGMDYVILLISDAYLKSANCMYEVMEVMRDRNYKNKIFPVVINRGIYSPAIRANYVIHWQKQYEELNCVLKEIDIQNLGHLGTDLKRLQDISSNIAEFLDLVSDLNNPSIEAAGVAIERKLIECNIVSKRYENSIMDSVNEDLFETLGIPKLQKSGTMSELEVDQCMAKSFRKIKELLEKLCVQFQTTHDEYQITVEHINTRESFWLFYRNGKKISGLKLFLNDSFGTCNIGISNTTHYYSGNTSWNAMYSAELADGKLGFKATMSLFGNSGILDVDGVVKDIWTRHIQPYIDC